MLRVETIYQVKYLDLNEFIRNETQDKYYDCYGDLGIDKGGVAEILVRHADGFEYEVYRQHLVKRKEYVLNVILNVKCFEGKIKPGKYLICGPWR